MMLKRAVKENIYAVGIALVLSFVVFIGIQNTALLTADIAGTQVEFSDDSDLVSYVDGQQLNIGVTRSFPDAESISMLVFYDPEAVKLERESIATDYTLSYATADPGRASIGIAGDLSRMQQGDTLVSFDLLGDPRDLTVSDIVIKFVDGSSDKLSIAIK